MILLIGSEGSMGKRYQAILNDMGKEFDCADIYDHVSDFEQYDGFIVASPTMTHFDYLIRLAECKKPILIEKPISRNLREVKEALTVAGYHKAPIKMMLQYEILTCEKSEGLSFYDYFRHGNDGLVWDCMQIVGLAKGEVELHEKSPVWKCAINGKVLSNQNMDLAYCDFVYNWFRNPNDQSPSKLLDIHVKTDDLAKSGKYE